MNILNVQSENPELPTSCPSLIGCFICRSISNPFNTNDFKQQQDIRDKYLFTGSNGNPILNRQLWNIFLVKKLLSVSDSVCERILIKVTTDSDKHQKENEDSCLQDSNLWFYVCHHCSPSLEEGWKIYAKIVRLEGKLRELGSRLRGQIKASGRDNELEETAAVEKRIWECLSNKNDNSIVKQEVDHFENSNDWDVKSSTNDGDHPDELFIKKEDDLDIDSDPDPVPPSPLRLPLNQKSKRSRQIIKKAKSSLRSHSKSKNPNMKCPRCGQIFRQPSELNSHLQLHSKSDQNGNQFDCPLCNYPCFSETNLRQHKSRKHKHTTNYPCDICGYLAPGKKRLARHRKLHEHLVDPKTYQCDLCPKDNQFFSYLSFTRHQRLNHAQELGITLYQCPTCPSVYTTNKMLQDHILHVHQKNSRWCCEICGKGLLSENNLKEHLTTHEPKNRTEICYVCGVDFLNERTLREHVRKFHPDYSNHRKDKTKVLEEKGEGDKCYKCLYCTFTSPFRLVVMRHRKEHSEVFRHSCEICENGYSTKSSLKLHRKISHGDGGHVVKCDWCGKSFAHKHYLQNHQPRCKMRPVGVNLGRNRKPFKDTLLVTTNDDGDGDNVIVKRVKVPRKKKDVKLEEVDESGRKLMTCKYCSTFKTDNRGKMYGHVMQEHRDSLEFKYSCHLCGMRYTSKPSLTRHMVIVHPSDDNAKVNCQFCEKQFRHWSLLRVHYKFWCKAMPEGIPIPEPPNKKGREKEEGTFKGGEKGKELKFRVDRKRDGGGVRARKASKAPGQSEQDNRSGGKDGGPGQAFREDEQHEIKVPLEGSSVFGGGEVLERTWW